MVWLGALWVALAAAAPAVAAEAALEVAPWTAVPFVALLLAIALLPLVAHHFWEQNRNKALVAFVAALPVVAYLLARNAATDGAALAALGHELWQYVSFIVLLGALYTVSGGILLAGDLEARPRTNVAFLALGAVLANFIGTTGAGMLLIRPVLQINQERKNTRHIVVFFVFIVCNLGGLLTPLGDPPLFLGFLNGVDFFWTLRLWPQWLLANGLVLLIFWCWDAYAYRHESAAALAEDRGHIEPLRLTGKVNFLFLAGIVAAALLQSERFSVPVENALRRFVPLPAGALGSPFGEALMAAMGLLSWVVTPRQLREANGFGWGAILEVAILFAGIFVTMVPALALLTAHGRALGVTQPWEYFWLTGILSSFLDNAPTYVTFATLAAGSSDFSLLTGPPVAGLDRPLVLQAISCGAVFMGANTYIGNGPNFMVKAIADQAGYRTPSFFGYLAYSTTVLLPVFGIVTVVFFRPG